MRAFTQLIFIDDQDGGAGKLAVAKFFPVLGSLLPAGKFAAKVQECNAAVAHLKM